MARTPRRRRNNNLGGFRQRLGVNEDALDRKKFAYRWVNEDQLENRTSEDDWDPVPNGKRGGEQDTTDMGANISRVVGKHENGAPKRAVLCRKPKGFYDEDRAAVQARVDETMTAIKGGHAGLKDPREAEHMYTPTEGISIRRG